MQLQSFTYTGHVRLPAVNSRAGEVLDLCGKVVWQQGQQIRHAQRAGKIPRKPTCRNDQEPRAAGRVSRQAAHAYAFSVMGSVQDAAVSTRSRVYVAVNPLLGLCARLYVGGLRAESAAERSELLRAESKCGR